MEKTKAEDKVVKMIGQGKRKVRRGARYAHRMYTLWIGTVLLTLLIGYLAGGWVGAHTFTWQTPLIIKSVPKYEPFYNPTGRPLYGPYLDEIREAGGSAGTVTPTKAPRKAIKQSNLNTSEESIVKSLPHGDILWIQYQLETQRGKTDNCRLQGKGYGGWGVKDDVTFHCYESFKLAAERANYWFDRNLKRNGGDIPTTLCEWSGHGKVTYCEYVKNYLSMAK